MIVVLLVKNARACVCGERGEKVSKRGTVTEIPSKVDLNCALILQYYKNYGETCFKSITQHRVFFPPHPKKFKFNMFFYKSLFEHY